MTAALILDKSSMKTLWCNLNAASAIKLCKLRPGEPASLGEIDNTQFTLTDTGIRRYDPTLPDTWLRTAMLSVVLDAGENTYPVWMNHGIHHAVIYDDGGEVFAAISDLVLAAAIRNWKENEQWRNECNRRQAAWTRFVTEAQKRPWGLIGWRYRLYSWRSRLKNKLWSLVTACRVRW